MLVDVSSGELYPYVFVSTEEEEVAVYAGAEAATMRKVVKDWRKRAYDVPDEIVQPLLDARKAADAALARLEAWFNEQHPDSIRWY